MVDHSIYESWLEREKYEWSEMGYEFTPIQNGVSLIHRNNEITSTWNDELYDVLKDGFKDCKFFYVYVLKNNGFIHYFDFEYNNQFYRLVSKEDKNELSKNFNYYYDETCHLHGDWESLENETLLNIHEKFHLILNTLSNLPKFRIKFAIRELLPFHEQKPCTFEKIIQERNLMKKNVSIC